MVRISKRFHGKLFTGLDVQTVLTGQSTGIDETRLTIDTNVVKQVKIVRQQAPG